MLLFDGYFVFFQMLSSYLFRDFQFFLLLKLNYFFFNNLVLVLLILFSAVFHSLSDLIEAADDIFSDFKLKFIDVFVVYILDCVSYKLLIHTFTEQGTRFQNKAHFLLSQKLTIRVVFV